jgi:aerobic-type carbon monoxide dehydrogenase small subunit (CoxS/CutS family)
MKTLHLLINDTPHELSAAPGESLLSALRRLGYYGVKHGCESGECGACAILLDGKPVNTCVLLAAQAEGHPIQTIEAIGEHPEQGWRTTGGLHPIQQAFVESAINAVSAPPPRSWPPKSCWSAIRTRLKRKCAKLYPACCVAAQVI